MKKKTWDVTVKDNPNKVVMGENDEFYTSDTEAYLIFNLQDKFFSPRTATLTLENRNDGSLKSEEIAVVDGVIEWEMPQRYIEHFGHWQGQLVYGDTKDGQPELYTSATFTFVVNAHIGDKKKPSLVEIENWEKFIRDGTELIETWEDMEDLRQANEAQRQANYQELLDTGVLQTNINTKLEALEEEYAPKLTEVTTQLAHKATKDELQQVSLAYKESYATLASLQTAYPTGDIYNHAVLTDNLIYTYKNGWISTGIQANGTGLADGTVTTSKYANKSITPSKISDTTYVTTASVNRFDKTKALQGHANTPSGLVESANWYATDVFVPVKTGDVVRAYPAHSATIYTYDNSQAYFTNQSPATNNTLLEYTIPSHISYVKFNIFKDNINSFMFTINDDMPTTYQPFSEDSVVINWLDVKDKSITLSKFSDEVIQKIDSKADNGGGTIPNITRDWEGVSGVALGTSITYQDGRVYAQGDIGAVARGYQTIIKEKLGLSNILNKGMSGTPLANRTTSGDGLIETGKTIDYSVQDLVIIEAGTNDFKLNLPIGTEGEISDTTFDNNTFYGAFRELIEFILSDNPKARIVLFTPLQRNNGGYNSWETVNTAGHKLVDYVEAIKVIGRMYSLHVIDLFTKAGFNKFTLATYTMDGLHPNDEGYQIMGEIATREILANVAPPKVE